MKFLKVFDKIYIKYYFNIQLSNEKLLISKPLGYYNELHHGLSTSVWYSTPRTVYFRVVFYTTWLSTSVWYSFYDTDCLLPCGILYLFCRRNARLANILNLVLVSMMSLFTTTGSMPLLVEIYFPVVIPSPVVVLTWIVIDMVIFINLVFTNFWIFWNTKAFLPQA